MRVEVEKKNENLINIYKKWIADIISIGMISLVFKKRISVNEKLLEFVNYRDFTGNRIQCSTGLRLGTTIIFNLCEQFF